MAATLQQWLYPPQFKEQERNRVALLIYTIMAVTLVLSVFASTTAIFVSQGPLVNLVPNLVIVLAQLGAFWVLRAGYVQAAAWGMVTTLWLGIAATSILIGGLNAATLSLLSVCVIIAALTTGRTGNQIFTLSTIIFLTALYIYQQHVGDITQFLGQSNANVWLTGVVAVTAISIFLDVAMRTLHDAIDEARANGERLRGLVEDLQQTTVSKSYVYSILESMLDMLIVLDANLRIETVNPALLQTLGYTEGELTGQPFSMLFGDQNLALLDQVQGLLDDSTQDLHTTATYRTHTGDELAIYIAATRMTTDDQKQRVVCVSQDITDRIRAEQKLMEERNLLRTLIDTLPDIIYVKDKDLRYVLSNKQHQKRFGLSENTESVVGKPTSALEPKQLVPIIEEQERWVLSGETLLNHRATAQMPDGETRQVMISKIPLSASGSGEITGLLAVIRDVTQQVEAEKKLAYERNLLRTLLDSLPEYIHVKDMAGHYIISNRAHMQLVGVTSQADIIGKTSEELFGAQTAAKYLEDDEYIRNTGQPILGVERWGLDAEGNKVWVHTNKVPLKNKNGAINGIVAIATDITQRKLQEEKLQASVARNRALLDALPDMMFVLDKDGTHIELKSEQEADLIAPQEDLLGTSLQALFPDDVSKTYMDAIQACLETGTLQSINYRLQTMGGEGYFEARLAHLNPNEVVSIVRNITEKYEAEEEIRQREQMYRTLVRNLPDTAVMLYDTDLRFIIAEGQPLRLSGFNPENLEGRKLQDVLPAGNDNFIAAYRLALKGETVRFDFTMPGSNIYFAITIVPLYNRQGTIFAGMVVALDVTEERQREAALQQYAKALESSNDELQQFAYVASHDLQEPLRKIQAFGDRLAKRSGDNLDPTSADYLKRMQSAAGRMQKLIQDLLAFSRVTTRAKPFQPVDLERVVRGVLADLELRIEQTDAVLNIGSLPAIEAEELQMRQLFQNLLGNALKYTRPDTRPEISVRQAAPPSNHMIQIEVTDNGIGFDSKYTDRIFGLFQRLHTRQQYEGTGMGLAICRKIVERHGGTIIANGTENRGATFVITLPRHQPDTKAPIHDDLHN